MAPGMTHSLHRKHILQYLYTPSQEVRTRVSVTTVPGCLRHMETFPVSLSHNRVCTVGKGIKFGSGGVRLERVPVGNLRGT